MGETRKSDLNHWLLIVENFASDNGKAECAGPTTLDDTFDNVDLDQPGIRRGLVACWNWDRLSRKAILAQGMNIASPVNTSLSRPRVKRFSPWGHPRLVMGLLRVMINYFFTDAFSWWMRLSFLKDQFVCDLAWIVWKPLGFLPKGLKFHLGNVIMDLTDILLNRLGKDWYPDCVIEHVFVETFFDLKGYPSTL